MVERKRFAMTLKILVASCDNNEDLFDPFYLCVEKYWKDHPEIIYSTESAINTHYNTICKNIPINKWTKRIRETIEEIDSDYILFMCDDVFIRKYVDNQKVMSLLNIFNDNIASINLEMSFDKNDLPYNEDLMIRSINGKFKTSVMCNIFNRKKLLKILSNLDINPWQFESLNNHLGYTYLVTKRNDFVSWGYTYGGWFGIRKGKWCREIVPFFEKEGIKIDYSKRGFSD